MPPSSEAPLLAAGVLLARRYRIVELLGRGGMGEVYGAEDLDLDRIVALKTLRARRAADPQGVARLKSEVRLAQRVSHPNVCRIYDVGFDGHAAAPAEGGSVATPVAFFTMERVAGESLAERLRRGGPLTLDAALRVARQVAEGLAAVHAAGLVHRDLKPANVLLSGDEGAWTVKLTDFGLAHAPADTAPFAATSSGGGGTPAYMAPEQRDGREVGPAIDVYAFGLVLYEMLAGALPPRPPKDETIRLPPAPSLRADVRRALEACLHATPSRRPRSAREVVAALEAGSGLARRLGLSRSRASRGLWLGGLAIGAAGLALAELRAAPFDVALPATVALAPSVPKASPDRVWADGAAEVLAAGLAVGDALRPADAQETGGADVLLALDAHEARSWLGGAHIAVKLDVRRGRDDRHLGSFRVACAPAELAPCITKLADDVRARFRLPRLSALDAERGRALLPASPEAMVSYVRGQSALRSFDPVTAQVALREAVERAPTFVYGYPALAEALAALRSEPAARAAATKALELAEPLGRDERLALGARLAYAVHDWREAEQKYAALVALRPGRPADVARLVQARAEAGDLAGAEAAVAHFREEPALRDDGSLLLVEARVALRAGKPERAETAARRAAEIGRRAGSPWSEGWAQNLVCQAQSRRHALDEAEASCAEAARLLASVGDELSAAEVNVTRALGARQRGRAAEGLLMLDDVLALAEKTKSPALEARARSARAILEKSLGHTERALAEWERAQTLYGSQGDRAGQLSALLNQAGALADEGELARGRGLLEDAARRARSLGDAASEALALQNLGLVLLREGDAMRAELVVEDAVRLQREHELTGDVPSGLDTLGLVLLERRKLARAREALEEALSMRESQGGIAASTRQNLAMVALEEGRVAEAERLALEAKAELHRAKQPEAELLAGDVLVRVYLRQRRGAEAEALLDEGLAGIAEAAARERFARPRVAWRARARFAQGKIDEALRLLRDAILRSGDGLDEASLADRLTLAELLLMGGEPAQGRRILTDLGARARARGVSWAQPRIERILNDGPRLW